MLNGVFNHYSHSPLERRDPSERETMQQSPSILFPLASGWAPPLKDNAKAGMNKIERAM